MHSKTADMAYIALGTVIIAVCSWISIPFAVPFTMQTFAVFFVLMFLGGKRGTLCIVVFILLAAIGIPVLSGFKGGIGAVLGTTGGYLLGFIFTGLIYMLFEKTAGNRLSVKIAVLAAGLIVCYAFGTAWFMTVYAKNSGPIGLWTALSWCVLPFIIPDIVKLALAAAVSERLRKTIKPQ